MHEAIMSGSQTPILEKPNGHVNGRLSDDIEQAMERNLAKSAEKSGAGVAAPRPLPLREQIINMGCIVLNTTTTVGIVFMNKTIFKDPRLRNMQMSFAMWHFACTAIVLWIAGHAPFNLFVPVRLPLAKMVPLCTFFAGFLILNNLSLTYNSVGFYQLAKIMTTPTVVFLNYVLFRKPVTAAIAASLLAVCFGVTLTNTNSTESNFLGAALAIAAFIVTALYQIWIGKKLVDFNVSSPQLLMNQAPISVVLLAFTVPFFDTITDIREVPSNTLVILFLSGIVASLLNLSQFMIIGRMSALTFNVASNLKTVIILGLGWVHDARVLTARDALGIILAVGGAATYSQLSQPR